MTTWINYANFAISISGLIVSILVFLMLLRNQSLNFKVKRVYLYLFLVLIILLSLSLIPQILYVVLGKHSDLFSGLPEKILLIVFLVLLAINIFDIAIFIYTVRRDISQNIEQKTKIEELDFKVRALQIRPHFIYNTLSNVYYLCELDPLKAQKVIDDFSTYLKKNFSAVTKQGLVSFEEELEHTKAYVAVVQARYEDMLFVDFDTPLMNFKLPPLTLEPLVENAVKHALDPDSEPLYIMVRTRRENSFNLIIVENTGVNFPFEDNDSFPSSGLNDEPHIGLSNVKSRLAASCGGSLKLSKRPDGGTIATIRIPADQTASLIGKQEGYRSLNINKG